MIRYHYIIFLLLVLLGNDLKAQSFSAKVQKLSIEDGLSNRFVRRTFQDSKGFIWLGTNYGLNRYDGYSFKLFTRENEGLSSNIIHNIYEDSDSCLWITYLDAEGKPLPNIDVLNLNTLMVEPFANKVGKECAIKEDEIFELYQASSQELFFVTKDKRVFEYQGRSRCQELFKLPYPTHKLNSILKADQNIWVAGEGFLLEYNESGELQEQAQLPFKSVLDMNWEEGTLSGFARSLNDSLMTFSKRVGQPTDYEIVALFSEDLEKLNNGSKIKQAPNGLIWYNDMNISRMYNSKGELVYDFSEQLPDKSIHSIFSVCFDNNNSAWLATTGGVLVLTVRPNLFHSYLNYDEFVPNSKAYSTRGILEYDGFLYVNSYSGRRRINLETGDVEDIDSDGRDPELDIMLDKDGYIWFCGERKSSVQRFNPQTNEITNIPCKSLTGEMEKDNLKLFQDSRGRIWLGTTQGVYYLDTVHHAFIKHGAYGLCSKLNNSAVYAFAEDSVEQVLWVGSSKGIYKYDYKLGRFTREYAPNREAPYYIPHGYILYIHKDKNEDFYWLGTYEGGVIKWSPKTGEHEHFTVATGLSDNVVYSILEDDNGYLWFASNYGLMRFAKEEEWCNIYLPRDGITAEEFNTFSVHQSASGRFYFGGINGVIAFYPNHFQDKGNSNIPIHVLSYEYLRGDVEQLEDRTEQLMKEEIITLGPNDNFFRLTFSLLDFREPSQNRYAYKIEGSGQSWQYTSENVVRVNRLPYGKYTLVVRGRGFDGQWSSREIRIPIVMNVAFYKTRGFLIAMSILFGLVVLGLARMAIRNSEKNKVYLEEEIANRTQTLLEREQDLLKAKEEAEKSSHAKAEFLSVMSHEIRTPMNAVVNLTNFLLEDNPTQKQVENLNILKFSANNLLAIINDVLDFNKIESGKVDFEHIDFDLLSLLDSIHYGMEVNAKQKNIYFFLDADINLPQMLVGDPNRLTQILNNLISNAIKFTEKGHVKLQLTLVHETPQDITLRFDVEDTGIGIAKEEMNYIFNMFTQAASDTTRKYGGTGLGLAITKRLLQLQDSDIELTSEVGKGSTFSFVLKFDKGKALSSKRFKHKRATTNGQLLEGAKILVVEDNAVNVLVVKKFLKKWGIEFTHAADGEEAIQKITTSSFDLILMDIHMPNMDGYTASRQIRKMNGQEYRDIPIIALTASALMDNQNKVFEAGMNDIVVKPFNPSELYEILTKYLVVS